MADLPESSILGKTRLHSLTNNPGVEFGVKLLFPKTYFCIMLHGHVGFEIRMRLCTEGKDFRQ